MRKKFLFCLRNGVLEHLSDMKGGSEKQTTKNTYTQKTTQTKKKPQPNRKTTKKSPPPKLTKPTTNNQPKQQNKTNLSNSFNEWTLKFYDSITWMPMLGLQLSGLAAEVGLGGLADAIQSSTPVTHSSEVTENVVFHWISMLSARGKWCAASRGCFIESSYVDWTIKIKKFSSFKP